MMLLSAGGLPHDGVGGDGGLGERVRGGVGQGRHQRVADLQGAAGAGQGEVQPVARAAPAPPPVAAHRPAGARHPLAPPRAPRRALRRAARTPATDPGTPCQF